MNNTEFIEFKITEVPEILMIITDFKSLIETIAIALEDENFFLPTPVLNLYQELQEKYKD